MQVDDNTFVTGSVSGLITIQKQKDPARAPQKKKVSFKYVSDTSTKPNDLVDTYVLPLKSDKLSKYEFALRKFQYSKALDVVMAQPIPFKTPAVVVTVFDELIRYDEVDTDFFLENSRSFIPNRMIYFPGERDYFTHYPIENPNSCH